MIVIKSVSSNRWQFQYSFFVYLDICRWIGCAVGSWSRGVARPKAFVNPSRHGRWIGCCVNVRAHVRDDPFVAPLRIKPKEDEDGDTWQCNSRGNRKRCDVTFTLSTTPTDKSMEKSSSVTCEDVYNRLCAVSVGDCPHPLHNVDWWAPNNLVGSTSQRFFFSIFFFPGRKQNGRR